MNNKQNEQDGIAIIGIGCRYPGVHGPRDFLELIRSDRSTVSAPPASRIEHGYDIDRYLDPRARVPGKISSPYAGFLDHIEQFDPAPFGLIPRDVRAMEPQQRLMLEATWDALMDAGIPADSLQGERVAVIIGHMIEDYSRERIAVLGEDTVNRSLDVFTVMGMSRAALSGRISFLLGLTGPSMTLDTACSSALISVHLACRSLWTGESTMALAGGVNLFVTAEGNIALSRSGMLSPDGACKAFDADANGFVRGEGAGLLLLRPLRDALAHNDPIYAVIRGTGISTDGRDGGHMMAPGRKGQAQAMRDAYAQANRSPAEVDFVETHGTGTVIGDPVEIGALSDVMGPGRPPEKPLRVSSVKGHIGHSESASGAAGLICASLSLAHRELPAQMHFQTPSPHIPWDQIPVRVQAQPEPWPGEGPRLAGVNSFGISGTNAHVVLESAPVRSPSSEANRDSAKQAPYLFPVSAHDADALEATLRQLQTDLQSEAPPRLEDLAYTLGSRRQHHRHRAAFVAHDRTSLTAEIDAQLRGQDSGASAVGVQTDTTDQEAIFVFPGQGGQTEEMGRELFEDEPVFRSSIESLDAEFAQHADWCLVDAIRDPQGMQTLQRLSRLQPTLIAVEIALAELWSHWGVRPNAVVGQSLGEIAAAFIAGALDRSTVARLACERGRIVEQASGSGAMAAVVLNEENLEQRLAPWQKEIEIAGITSPTSALVSGNRDAVLDFVAELESDGVFARTLEVDFASHCFHMDPLLDPFHECLEGMTSRASQIPIYSTVDQRIVAGEELDRQYWVRNLRAPVRFSSTLTQALEDGGRKVVEISPHPTLSRAIPEIAEGVGTRVRAVSSLVRDRGERASLMRSLAALYVDGQHVDFEFAGPRGQVLRMSPYPYQRQRFWFAQRNRGDLPRSDHEWLGTRINLAGSPDVILWQARLDRDNCPFLEDYRLKGPRVLPASVLIEAALAAARAIWPESETRLRDVSFWPLVRLEENEQIELQIRLTKETSTTGSLTIMSRATPADMWSERAQAFVDSTQGPVHVELPREPLRVENSEQADDWYARLAEGGLQLGRRMRTLRRLTRDHTDCEMELMLPPLAESESYAYAAHPALLETGLALCAPNQQAAQVRRIREIRLVAPLPTETQGRITSTTEGPDLRYFDSSGRLFAELHGVEMQPLRREEAQKSSLYPLMWTPVESNLPSTPPRFGHWILDGDDPTVIAALAAELEKRGARCSRATDESADDGGPFNDEPSPSLLWIGRPDEPVGQSLATWVGQTLADGITPDVVWRIDRVENPQDRPAPQGLIPAQDSSAGRRVRRPARRARIALGAEVPELATLAQWITQHDEEPVISCEHRQICALRLGEPTAAEERPAPLSTRQAGSRPFIARIMQPGEPEGVGLTFDPSGERALEPHQIRVEVESARLREHSLPKIFGLPSAHSARPSELTADGVGRVVSTGNQVQSLSIGDRVLATGPLARNWTLPASDVIKLPEAAPTTLAAAHLRDLAEAIRLLDESPGASTRVWVHGGDRETSLALVALGQTQGRTMIVTGATGQRAAALAGLGAELPRENAPHLTSLEPVDLAICLERRLPSDPALSFLRPGGKLVDAFPRDELDDGPVPQLRLRAGRSWVSSAPDASNQPTPLSEHPDLPEALAALPSLQNKLGQPTLFPVKDLSRALHYLAQQRGEAGALVHFKHADQTPILSASGRSLLFDAESDYVLDCEQSDDRQIVTNWLQAHGAHKILSEPTADTANDGDLSQRTFILRRASLDPDHHALPPHRLSLHIGLQALFDPSDPAWKDAGTRSNAATPTRIFLPDNSGPPQIEQALAAAFQMRLPRGTFVALGSNLREAQGEVEGGLLAALTPRTEESEHSVALREELAQLSTGRRVDRVLARIIAAIGVVVGLDESDRGHLRAESALEDLGLDSLMTLELAVALQTELALEFERGTLAAGRDLRSIAQSIASQLA